jgi:hypothetical protein
MPPRIPMTTRQCLALLALPDTEEAVIRLHSLLAADHAGIATARTPETRLGYALQLCCALVALGAVGYRLKRKKAATAA